MKKLFLNVLSVAVFSLLIAAPALPGVVRAETESTDEKIEKTLDNRIQQYKKEHPATLSAAQLARLKAVCKPAQEKTKGFTRVAVDKGDQRLKFYETAATRVEQLTKKIESYNANKDTKQPIALEDIKAQLAELKAEITKFKSDISSYQVALNDLSTLNCVQFTDTFKSALEEVRTTQEALVASSQKVASLISEQIKPELKELKLQYLATQAPAAEAKPDADADNNSSNTEESE